MSYGLKVFSSNGSIQIDTDNNNKKIYQLSTSGTVNIPSRSSLGLGYNSSNYCYATVSSISGFNSNYSLVFVRPTATAGFVNQSTFAEVVASGFKLYSSLESTSYDYYIFNPTEVSGTNIVSAPTGYGLVVYGDDGTSIRFSSDSKALRTKGLITNNGSISGTKLAALQQRKFSTIKPAALSPMQFFAWTTIFYSNGSIGHGTDLWYIGTSGTGASEDAEPIILDIDVTTIIAEV